MQMQWQVSHAGLHTSMLSMTTTMMAKAYKCHSVSTQLSPPVHITTHRDVDERHDIHVIQQNASCIQQR